MAYDADNLVGRRKAALVNQWPKFFQWLSDRYGFHLETTVPGRPQHCPVHGGESGEAFKFFDDFAYTGGGICNSGCIKMSTGDKLVAGWLRTLQEANTPMLQKLLTDVGGAGESPDALAGMVIDTFLEEHNIPLPPPKVGTQVSRWIKSIDIRVAIKYLSTRGLSFTPDSIPESLRGSTRYWAHPDYQNAQGLLALVYGEGDRPVTHQVIMTNEHGEKLGTRKEDQLFLDLLRDGKQNGKKPSVKKLASLDRQEDLSFRYVPLGNDSSDVLLLGEGVETVLAGRKIFEFMEKTTPMARAMVGSPYQNQQIPDHVTKVYALIDNDHTIESAQEQLEYLAGVYPKVQFQMAIPEKWDGGLADAERGRGVPDKGKDWLDTYVRRGEEGSASIWKDGLKPIKATGRGPAQLGGYQGASGRRGVRNGPQMDLRDYEVQVPVSDYRFFRNLNSILKRNPLNWFSDDEGRMCKVVEGHAVKMDEQGVLADMACHLQFTTDAGGNRNVRPKEVSFPEARIKRWLRTPQFRWSSQSMLPRLVGSRASFMLGFDEGAWQFRQTPGYWASQKLFLDVAPLHKKALERADSWIRMCESQPELVAIEIGLLKPELADYVRKNKAVQAPETLVRITSALLVEEVLAKSLIVEDDESWPKVCEELFSALVVDTTVDQQSLELLRPGARTRNDADRREAYAAILYLCLKGWAMYSNTSIEMDRREVVNSLMRWCGVDVNAHVHQRSSNYSCAVS